MRISINSRWRRLLGTAIALALVAAMASVCLQLSHADAATAPTWSTVSPATSPPPLSYASMAYDSDNGTLVLFGGQTTAGALSATTWIWSGSSWSQVASAVPARARASMAFDPALHQLILFGGVGAGGQLLNDTWAWNGATWYQEGSQAQATLPPPREGASLAFDANDQLLLFGGSTSAAAGATSIGNAATSTASGAATTPATTVLGDTWVWTGSTWTQQQASGPPARTDAGMTWDPLTSQTVLFGGSTAPTGSSPTSGLLAETWAWGTGSWGPVAPAASPPAEEDLALVADPDLGGMIAFGGTTAAAPSNQTWLWDGATWSNLNPSGSPSPRQGAAAAYDAAAHQLVLFGGMGAGGATLGDTEILTAHAPTTAVPTPAPTPVSTPAAHGQMTTPTTTAIRAGHPPTSVTTTPATIPTSAGDGGRRTPSVTAQLHPGGLMTLHGSGFASGAAITITFHSTPAVVGRSVATDAGDFTATVAVPTHASAGLHHFEAAGMGAEGVALLVVTPVEVVLLAVHHQTVPATLALVAISVALPAVAWLVMEVRGRRRRPTPLTA